MKIFPTLRPSKLQPKLIEIDRLVVGLSRGLILLPNSRAALKEPRDLTWLVTLGPIMRKVCQQG